MRGITLRKGNAFLLPDTFWEIRARNWAIWCERFGEIRLAGVIKGMSPMSGRVIRHVPEAGRRGLVISLRASGGTPVA
jgi:molybdate transport system ATP-binding protein